MLAPSYVVDAERGTVPDCVEAQKRAHYARLSAEPGVRVWPFGVSSVGQLGTSAQSLCDLLAKKCADAGVRWNRHYWLARFGVVLWKTANAMHVRWARDATACHSSMSNAKNDRDNDSQEAMDPPPALPAGA